MEPTDVEPKLAQAMRDAMIPNDQPLTSDLKLATIDGIDSVSKVRLMMAIEELFSIEIQTREAVRIETIGDLTTLILSKTGAA